MRPRFVVPRALFAALATALLGAALVVALSASAGAAPDVLVGRYAGSTAQEKPVTLRVERDGGKLEVAEFASAIKSQCPDSVGTQEAVFNGGKGTAINDGRAEFGALGGGVKVKLILGGPLALGTISYSFTDCKGSVNFSAPYQSPDPILQAGRYIGKNSEKEDILMVVTQKRGYFELTDFQGGVRDCKDHTFGIDEAPKVLIDGDGTVDFKVLSGRATVNVKFHHRSHAEGRIVYAHGDCRGDTNIGARLKPAS
jgi:hypothetical protein